VFNQPVKVTVFGQGFADPVAVSLASIAAQVLSTSGTEIQVLSGVPNVSSCTDISGPVHVTNINNGDSADGPKFFYLVSKPALFNIAPASGSQNGGTPLTITGSFPDPFRTQVLLGQQTAFPTPGTTPTTTTLFVTTPPFSGTFPTQPCTGFGACGGTGTQNIPQTVSVTLTDAITSCTTTAAGAFTYLPSDASCHTTPPAAPQAAFTVTVPSGSPKAFFNNTSTGTGLSFSWDFGDPGSGALNFSTDPNPPPHTYPPGDHQVKLTVTDCLGRPSTAVSPPFHTPGA
jgi:hypothetical protein